MKIRFKKNGGITLVALIITIIIMLILVAVSVNVIVKSNLIGTAEKAADGYKTAQEKESGLGGITIDGEKYDSIEEYVNRLNLMYKEDNGKVRIYLKDSLYDWADKLSLEDKNSFWLKYSSITFEDNLNNYITKQCDGNEQKYFSSLKAIGRDDATNMFFLLCLSELCMESDEIYQELIKFFQEKVNLTFENKTEELSTYGKTYVITKNGTYNFTAKSEDGRTGKLEIETNFEEGKFKIDIEDVGIKEYTFIKGLTYKELIGDERVITMPDGVIIGASADYIPYLAYNNTTFYNLWIDYSVDYSELIEDGKTYIATKYTD